MDELVLFPKPEITETNLQVYTSKDGEDVVVAPISLWLELEYKKSVIYDEILGKVRAND